MCVIYLTPNTNVLPSLHTTLSPYGCFSLRLFLPPALDVDAETSAASTKALASSVKAGAKVNDDDDDEMDDDWDLNALEAAAVAGAAAGAEPGPGGVCECRQAVEVGVGRLLFTDAEDSAAI